MTRRSITALTLFASFALVACEDGPTQTYNAVPPNTTPNGTPGSVVSPGSQSFTSQVGGQTKTEICTADVKAKRWKWMVQQPIMPPSIGAGIDEAGGDTWGGLTIDQAEQYNGKGGDDPGTLISPGTPKGGLCQSTNVGDQFGNGTIVNTWGDGFEVWMDYRVSTRKALWLNMWQGYAGEVTATLPADEGGDKWEIPLAPNPIKKNGTPVTIDWLAKDHQDFNKPFPQIYRALIHTFAPALPLDAKDDLSCTDSMGAKSPCTCYDTGRCIQGSFGDVAYFYVPAIGFAMWVDNQNAPQPTPSIMTRFDQDLAKVMAFSFANPLMKLDKEGPIANAGSLQSGKPECTLKMGQLFGDFLANCVQTTGDAAKDKTELNKLLGGLSHGTERFRFDLTGVDVNFSDNTLPDTTIVRDNDVPTPDDYASQFNVDQSTLGFIANDYQNNDVSTNKKDLHGTGAVYREYLRLVRKDLLSLAGIADGDTSKCVYPVGYDKSATFYRSTFYDTVPAYCTGFEAFISPGQPTGPADNNNLGTKALLIPPYGLETGLKPGHQKVIFCDDANGDFAGSGYSSCTKGDNFQTSFRRVLKIFGHGKLSNLPSEVRDVRFFWKEYVKAIVKYYLKAADPTVADLSGVQIDLDNLFFDSVGAGQFEIAEYVVRDFADKTTNPTDFVFTADVRNGIMSNYNFSRELYRGEELLYAASLEKPAEHGLGQENSGLLTNLFGSPVLSSAYPAKSSKGKTAYYCATNLDPRNCDFRTCPRNAAGDDCLKDELNRPILYGYRGAMAGSSSSFTLSIANPVPITIEKTYDTIQQAMIRVPLYVDPFDNASSPLDPMKKLVPWAPKQPGIGFPIALNGAIDKFVTTGQLDLSGTTISANIDYDIHIDGTTHKPDKDGRIDFKAVETTDYLGELFMCRDAASGDLLRVRMYTPVVEILNWFASHPGTYTSCSIVIRYSPFGNYADYITSLTNGVRVGITQGGGFGRVNDSTLFVPGQ